jgi:crotonobetainyl-CoA:carnitine CoA-transferase CaiB-like acyl-CoA transferase
VPLFECAQYSQTRIPEVQVTQIFESIRVIDLTQGMAGPLATMILADYGAEVIRLEPPGGDPWWDFPAYMVWNRGKKSVALDWSAAAARDQARQLVRGADIFIQSLRPGEVDRLGLGYEAMAAANPALIHFSISAFGQEGPYRNLGLYDGIVNAKAGRMRDQVGWQGHRPTYRAINDTSYHTAMFTIQALVAALRVRLMTGRGQRVETSLLAGTTAPNNTWRRFEGQSLPPDLYPKEIPKDAVIRGELVPDRRESDPYTAIPSQLCAPCKDGRWIMHSHIQQDLFKVWMNTIGFAWIWDDPRFRNAPRFANNEDRIALNLMIFERLKEKTSLEWREIYRRNPDCAGEIMQTTQEALHHDQFIANGHVIEIDDPRVGRITQVGPFAKMSETPAVISRPAPVPGQHTAEVLAAPPATAPTIRAAGITPKRPLEGLIMLELASWLAAPFSGALLADLGMRVIKVEPLSGDPYRAMITNEGMIRAFQGKENVALNLKSKQGQAILHQLVKRADVLMHNFRPGAPVRVGADYETLRKINPDLVYVYAASYGSTGPDSQRAAFNPTMGAFTGNSLFQSGEGNVPKGDQSPDPIAGSGVATGIMLGLAARLLTGKGQYVETSMMNSNIYCNSDDAFDYSGKPPRRMPDKAQLGLEATYRLYGTALGWVFLAVPFDQEFAAFCKVIGREDLALEPRFASRAGRYEHRTVLGDRLEPVFKTRTAEEWEQLLTAADLGCVRADAMGHRRFLHEDPHARAIGFMVPTQSRAFVDQAPRGRYWRHAPVVKFSETPCEEGKPYLGMGEHTREVLREFGYDNAAMARLKETNVIGLAD